MTFEQLLYVETLSHYHSLQDAADVLHISKSGLSLAISQLEDELDVKIFQRSTKGTILTPEGVQLLSSIANILQSKSQLETMAKLALTSKRNTIQIEYVNTMFKAFMEDFLEEHEKRYSNIYLKFTRNDMKTIIQHVRNQEIDAGFIAISSHDEHLIKDLRFKPVCYSKIVLAVPATNELVHKQNITLEDLKQQKFCLYDDAYHDYLFDRLQFLCGPLQLVLKTDDTWALNKTVATLNAVFFGREIQGKLSREDAEYEFVSIDIGHIINDTTTLGWILNPHQARNETILHMIDKITEHIKKNA